MKIAIITNCTSSCSLPVIPYLDGSTLPKNATHQSTAHEWSLRLKKAENDPLAKSSICAVRAMYTGLSFRTILQTLDILDQAKVDSTLFIVSLGFGLIKSEAQIASYNLNLMPPNESPSSLLGVITGEQFEAIRWWGAVNNALGKSESPIGKLITGGDYDLIIVAVTNSFLGLVSADIATAAQDPLFNRVRIVGPKASNWVSKYMRYIAKRGVIMPYTAAINEQMPGNRNDFAQRCAVHFVREILIPSTFDVNLDANTSAIAKLFPHEHRGKAIEANRERIKEVIQALKNEGISSVTEAYQKASTLNVPFDKFQLLWGIDDTEPPSADEMDDALEVLKISGIGKQYDNQPEVIETLRIFIEAVRKSGGGTFTVRDVCNWAKLYFSKRKMDLPETLQSPNKLGRLLSTYSDQLPIIKSTNVIGGKSYEVLR